MSQSKAPRVTIPVVKRKFDLFRVDYTMYRGNEERLWMLVCEAIYNIASRHARPGRGDDRAARDAVAPTSRRNPSRGLGRDLGAIAHAATPLERVAFDPSQHLSPSRAHRDRSRARRAENSRGAVKKKARAFRASLNPSYTPAKPSLHPRIRAIHRARGASCRRFSTASRSIADEEPSFFRSRARVFAAGVPARQTPTIPAIRVFRPPNRAAVVLAKRASPKREDMHGSRITRIPSISTHFPRIWALAGD